MQEVNLASIAGTYEQVVDLPFWLESSSASHAESVPATGECSDRHSLADEGYALPEFARRSAWTLRTARR